jgi:hypothetical protein
MEAADRGRHSAKFVAGRLLAAFVLLFAQMFGAALAGASFALPTRLELCVGGGEPFAGDRRPTTAHPPAIATSPAPCCLGCPSKPPLPSLAAVPLPGPVVRAEPRRPEPEPAPAQPTHAFRPPGRGPPLLS